jgi:hypothetical protein
LTAVPVGRHFTLGRVLMRSGAVFPRTIPVYLFVLAVTGVPSLYIYAWSSELYPEAYWDLAGADSWQAFFAKAAIDSLNIAVFDAIGSAWLLAAALGTLSGEALPFREILGRGLRAWPRLAPVMVLTSLAWVVLYVETDPIAGVVALVANIIIISAVWVYGPVIVAERRGIWDGLRRGLFLVSGNAWRSAILVVIYVVILFGAGFVADHFVPIGLSARFNWQYHATISVAGCVAFMINTSVTLVIGVCYVLLRNDKDGVPVAEIAPVFD